MDRLTNKQIRELMNEFSPSPGFILNLTRTKFEDLVEEAEELADNRYSDYEWQKLDGSLAGNILVGETTKVKDE